MEEYPNLCLDIVSGTEMYFNFSQDPDRWRKFFIKYQDRILYGTDNANLYEVADIENAQITCRMQEHFLLGEGELSVWDKKIQGIHLPREAAEKILGAISCAWPGPPIP